MGDREKTGVANPADGWLGEGRPPGDGKKASNAGSGMTKPGPAPDRESCPVTPLGTRSLVFYYFTADGQLVDLPSGRHTRQNLKALFGGNLGWCRENCPARDSDGNVRANTWSDDVLATVLMSWCTAAGLFDATAPVRGPGVWRNGLKGPLVHCGDVLIDMDSQETMPAGRRLEDVLYPAAPKLQRPADEPATARDGCMLLEAARIWRFRDLPDPEGIELGPELFVGWIGAAMLGGAPAWRSHLLVRAKHGAGKTWLAELASAALGAGAHAMHNNYTEPGLRQALTGEARALVLDEAESSDRYGRVQQVIELLRHMSGNEGVRSVRGSAGGQAQAFQVTGCAYLSAILPPQLVPQDRSRITVLDLDELDTGADAAGSTERARNAIEWAAKKSAGLRMRALAGWNRFNDSIGVYRSALLAAECSMRQADQLATLLAGRDLLCEDHVPHGDTAAEDVRRFTALLDELVIEDESGEGEQCLTHLYTSPVDSWRGGDRKTVSQMILKALDADGVPERRTLAAIGVRIENRRNPAQAWLCVANQNVGLDKIFADTRWHGGGWRGALRYLHNAMAWPVPLRFGGAQIRATALPAACLPQPDPPTSPEAQQRADDDTLAKDD